MQQDSLLNELMVELKSALVSKNWLQLDKVNELINIQLAIIETKEMPANTQGTLTKLLHVYNQMQLVCLQELNELANKMAKSQQE